MSFGIRGRLLAISASAVAFVVVLELFAQAAAGRSGREIEERVARYHAVHLLRVALADHLSIAERWLRERREEDLRLLEEGLLGLEARAAGIEAVADDSLDALFEARASRRGVEAYLPLVKEAALRRASGDPDYWSFFARAEKIAAYTDGYLTRLLSLALAAGEAEYRGILDRNRRVRNLVFAGILGSGLLSLAVLTVFSASITAPLRRLAKAAGRIAGGELGVLAEEPRSGDEVETLARAFNAMSANIRSLVQGLEEKADLQRRLHEEELALVQMGRALREAQFMNLQDQVRPHFLFNALNSIARSALLEEANRTEVLARGLGSLMRYALGSRGPFAGLGEELEVVREYLEFQSIRFGDRLTWELFMESGLEELAIPRFTLQPLVENAVRHGIEPRVEGGRVMVSVRRRGQGVRVLVADSGVGMEAGVLARLRAAARGEALGEPASDPATEAPGIGLANVEGRLRYRYGEAARLELSSRPGRGTIVRISLPLGEAT